MPPKSAQKVKTEPKAEKPLPQPQTPSKPKTKRKAPTPEPETSSPTPKKRVKKEAPPTQSLERDTRAAVPIDVAYKGHRVAGAVKDGKFGMTLELEGLGAFNLVKTLVFTEGEFEGLQAIILKPAKAFDFTKLPEEVRKRVYQIYFAANGIIGKEIVLEGKRPNKDIYAKAYSEGSKNRVAVLAVNKTIYQEAVGVLYDHTLKLESTTAVVEFMAQCSQSMKEKLKDIEIKTFVKSQSRIAMHNLSDAVNIRRLHFETGVSTEGDPEKAAKAFYTDASKFLEAVSGKIKEKGSGVKVLSFGKQALILKDGKDKAQPWRQTMREEFFEELEKKMK